MKSERLNVPSLLISSASLQILVLALGLGITHRMRLFAPAEIIAAAKAVLKAIVEIALQ
jgi:hypothetical protein